MNRRSTVHAAVLGAVVVAVLAGCGPRTAFDVQTQDVAVSLILGQRAAVNGAPLVPNPLAPTNLAGGANGTSVGNPSDTGGSGAAASGSGGSTTPAPVVPAPTAACPALNPLAPISVLPQTISAGPTVAHYRYRSTYQQTTGAATSTFTGNTDWSVGAASTPTALGYYTYPVTKVLTVAGATTTTTTTYQVEPTGLPTSLPPVPNVGVAVPTAPAVAVPGQPGLYMDGQTTTGVASFVPSTPVALVQFPIVVGASFTATGSDGTSEISFTSTVTKTTKVDACGKPVGVYEVTLSHGVLTTPGSSTPIVTFTETLDIDTADGGLVVGDTYNSSGAEVPSGTVTLAETDTINTAPKASS